MSDYGQSAQARVASHRLSETHALKQPFLDTITDRTGTRNVDTVYQNTTGKTIMVIYSDAGNAGELAGYVEAANPPTKKVSRINQGTCQTMTFMVPDNQYYKVTLVSGTSTQKAWYEVT